MFNEIAENKDDYTKFYEAFSKNLKLGIHEDSQNRLKLADLLRYHSTKSGEELTSLKDCVTRMKEGLKDIYCITGESRKAVENSHFLERLKKKGYKVLFMVDAIDEYAVGQLKEYDGKKWQGQRGGGEEVVREPLQDNQGHPWRQSREGRCLGQDRRLALLSRDGRVRVEREHGEDNEGAGAEGQQHGVVHVMESYMLSKKMMEVNPDNGIMEELRKRAEADKNNKSVKDLVMLLLTSGFSLEDLNTFSGC